VPPHVGYVTRYRGRVSFAPASPRRLISREDVEKQVRNRMTKADLGEHSARTELTMKKFGLLPRDFDVRDFMEKSSGPEVAGYYDPKTKKYRRRTGSRWSSGVRCWRMNSLTLCRSELRSG
jgi:hypothetical protein